MNSSLEHRTHNVDICVVGGGMAGLVAAVAAARRGSSVLLVHDRPVLGGNASSEVRMWICGAHGANKEEIQLLNRLRNPRGAFHTWDSVLWEYAKLTPGLTTLLNCSCNDGQMRDGRLSSINAWQLTTQTWHTINAKFFIDCSGDSILAPITGAETRSGREAREEFNESLAPTKADLKTMGNTILLQLEETTEEQPFTPPPWAYVFTKESTLPSRVGNGIGANFWWIELGGLNNTISDAETLRDELIKTVWGVWDYMKNRGPQADRLRNWRIRWMAGLPGKRENRRYMGPYVLTQNDVSAGGPFEDIIAYGGWSMDDHHPAGLLYPGKATLFHHAPSPYGIPFRSLYSRNVPNLFCAGRNISATHCALSSTRVMATCALLGQAVGTAAAICVQDGIEPAQISADSVRLKELQEQLMEDDCWLPGLAKPQSALALSAQLDAAAEILRNGHDRKIEEVDHAWEAPAGASVTMSWDAPQDVAALRLVFDSNLNDLKRMPCRYELGTPAETMPKNLVKALRVDVQTADGAWETALLEENNHRRLLTVAIGRPVKAVRFTGLSAWEEGAPIRVYAMEPTNRALPISQNPPKGRSWVDVVADLPAGDLAEPDHGLENASPGAGRVGA
jgi:hypothetical protein